MKPTQSGFTLLEIAIVILIIGLLTVAGFSALSGMRDSASYSENQRHLEDIKASLLRFVAVNGYLPCPDTDNNGQENRNINDKCQAVSGNLPFIDLGTQGFNAHGHRFSYHVNRDARHDIATSIFDPDESASYFGRPNDSATCISQCFDKTTPPTASNNGNGNMGINDGTSDIIVNLPVVIISHGKQPCATNPDAGFTIPVATLSFENRNCHFNSPVYFRAPQGNDFDDVLSWVSSLEIKRNAGLFNQP